MNTNYDKVYNYIKKYSERHYDIVFGWNKFSNFTPIIKDLTLPSTVKLIEEFGIEKIFEILCRHDNTYMLELIYEIHCDDINLHYDNDLYFSVSCINNNLTTAKWLYNICGYKIDISVQDNSIIKILCGKGYLHIIKWIWEIKPKDINLNADNNYIFNIACCNGNLDIIKWLIRTNNSGNLDFGFRLACAWNNLDTAKWIYSKCKKVNKEEAFKACCFKKHLNVAKWIYYDLGGIDIHYNKDIFIRKANNTEIFKWIFKLDKDYYCKLYNKIYIFYITSFIIENITFLNEHIDIFQIKMSTENFIKICKTKIYDEKIIEIICKKNNRFDYYKTYQNVIKPIINEKFDENNDYENNKNKFINSFGCKLYKNTKSHKKLN